MQNVTLNNGVEMPILGYGVYKISPEECEKNVLEAIGVGYRSIDTARFYQNEAGVGKAVARCGVPRDELFITTKLWTAEAGEDKAQDAIDDSLRTMGLDYIDLMLIHQPYNDYYGTYRAMEKALRAGKLHAIGVSNFAPDRFIDLASFVDIVPAVNQIETHPFNQQAEAHGILKEFKTVHESWAPFSEGMNGLFTDPVLTAVGEQYGKSAAQVTLRFLIQSDIVVIPKSSHVKRMEENIDVFDFALSDGDMEVIRSLDRQESIFGSFSDPAIVNMFTGRTPLVTL